MNKYEFYPYLNAVLSSRGKNMQVKNITQYASVLSVQEAKSFQSMKSRKKFWFREYDSGFIYLSLQFY